MRQCRGKFGIQVGSSTFTDIDCADYAVLFTADPAEWEEALRCGGRYGPRWSGAAMSELVIELDVRKFSAGRPRMLTHDLFAVANFLVNLAVDPAQLLLLLLLLLFWPTSTKPVGTKTLNI